MKRSLLLFLMAVAALAQTASQIESDEVKRVGTHLKCQCGCSDDINCNMSSGQCHFCKPARTKIYEMQKAGVSDSGIIESFVKQYGQGIFLSDPNSFFWLIPYLVILAGGGVIWLVLRRMRGHKVPVEDPLLARYRDAIERDTEQLN